MRRGALAIVVAVLASGAAEGHSVTETWTVRAKMPIAREGTAGAFIGGTFYVSHGSLPGAAGADSNLMSAYTPATDTWTTLSPAPTGRAELGGAAAGGIFYAIGGRNKAVGAPCGTPVCDTVEAYNPVTNTWATKAPMPTARAGIGVAVVGRKIYVAGGRTGKFYADCCALATLEIYDTATMTWTAGPPMPTARANVYSTVAIGSRIYVIGGYNPATSTMYATMEILDTATMTWSTGSAMPTARMNAGAGVCEGHIYVFGGTRIGSTTISIVEEFDPVTGTWTTAASMPAAASETAAGTTYHTPPGGSTVIMATGSGVFGDTKDQNFAMTCAPSVIMTGRATGLRVSGAASLTRSDTGEVSTESATAKEEKVSVLAGPPVTANGLVARVVTTVGSSTATATVAEALIAPGAGLPPITLRAVRAISGTTCEGSSGGVTIAHLAVGPTVIVDGPVSVPPNTGLSLPGGGSILLNEQTASHGTRDHELTVNAVHVTLAGIDIVVGSARSDIHVCP
ncbi:MAG: hypothetical protein HY775_00120 [Acidobacteria bacterium]|nr:hypothetical protein [Acidobacteriota bacterium]